MPFNDRVAHWRSLLGTLNDSALQEWFRSVDQRVLQHCEVLGGESPAQARARRRFELEAMEQALQSLPATLQRLNATQDMRRLLGTPTVPSPLMVLASWDAPLLQALIDKLTQDGFASDEDQVGLSSTMVERWGENCTRFLRTYGYTGGELVVDARYYSHVGNIYVLFDGDWHNRQDAQRYLNGLAKRHLPL